MIGIGYDVHKLVKGRKLILGGVVIPSDVGELAHSDGDVLLHAIIDALLGAMAEGDIGKHFPDTDPKHKDISSLKLLAHVSKIIKKIKFKVVNIDSTVVLQFHKIAPY